MATLSDWLNDFDFKSDFIDPLIDNGWFEFLFPFLLVYAVVLTIMNQVELFKDKKSVKVIIALVVSLFSIAFDIDNEGHTLGSFMMALFPGVTAFSIGILALYIVIAMLGVDLTKFFGKDADENKWIMYLLGILGVGVVIYYYAKGFGWDGYKGSDLQEFLEDPLLYILVIGAAVFYFITKDEPEEKGITKKIEVKEK